MVTDGNSGGGRAAVCAGVEAHAMLVAGATPQTGGHTERSGKLSGSAHTQITATGRDFVGASLTPAVGFIYYVLGCVYMSRNWVTRRAVPLCVSVTGLSFSLSGTPCRGLG